MVCQATELSKIIQALKRHTTKEIIQQLEIDKKMWILNLLSYYKKKHKTESEHPLWQEGFHPQQITSDEMLNQKIEYIHHNPVRRGLVSEPEHWVYSSVGDFILNRKGFIELQAMPV
jgi:REP element-mobilizing transposase RayT